MTSSSNKSGTNPSSSATKANLNKHSFPVYISDSLFRNKRLKQKRLKWQLAISKASKQRTRKTTRTQFAKTERNIRQSNFVLPLNPEITINLLSDDDEEVKDTIQQQPQHSLPQILVFPAHMQLSSVPNITLIPVHPMKTEIAATLQNHLRKRKSQKPKRHAEPTIVNKESIVLSDESNLSPIPEAETVPQIPVASSTPNHIEFPKSPISSSCPPPLKYFDSNYIPDHHNDNSELKISAVHSAGNVPSALQVDEEVTVSLVPRSAAGSCSSKGCNNTAELFPMVPDETTVHTIISNRLYELSLSKLREGLATSGAAEFADDKQQMMAQPNSIPKRKGTTFNLPPTLKQPNMQPVSLKLSSDLSISLISDDEEDLQQQRLNAESLLRQQPHLSVRPVGIVTLRQPPKRRKLG